jgi:hypothetical protein
MTRNDSRNWYVLLSVVGLLGGACAAWLVSVTFSDETVLLPIRLTARIAFVLYLVVLVARPLQQLLRMRWTAALLRHRRLVGVAFAGVMTVHLGLLVYRFGAQPELDHPSLNLLFGAAAYGLFYLMLITSFDAPKKAIGPKVWKVLHLTGLVWAGVIFGLPRSLESLSDPAYWQFGLPFVIALIIRITAWQLSRRPGG